MTADQSRERALIDAAWSQVAAVAMLSGSTADRGGSAGPGRGTTGGNTAVPEAPFAVPGYRILDELQRGGQGVVYLALQESTLRKVAIKVLRHGPFAGPSDVARFEREIDLLARLRHPGIVAVHDRGVVAGVGGACPYLVMDYVAGRPLDAWIAGAGGVPGGGAGGGRRRGRGRERPRDAGAVPEDLRGRARGAPGGHHPPRPQAGEHPRG